MKNYTKKFKEEMAFFIHPKTGRVSYNDLCNRCTEDCKQSFRAEIVCCPSYKSKRAIKSTENSGRKIFNDKAQ